MTTTIGIIGTGNMGRALAKGWLRSAPPDVQLLIWDKIRSVAQRLLTAPSIYEARSVEDLVASSDVTFVVVKPVDAHAVLSSIAPFLRKDQAIVSSMAGVGIARMREVLGGQPAILRIMPNLGVELGAGTVGVAREPGTSEEVFQRVYGLLTGLGMVIEVPESSLDVVTALSGTGPGLLALVVEGLEDGAVGAGLPRKLARTFARQTALDIARLLVDGASSAEEVAERMGFSVEGYSAGMRVMKERGVQAAFEKAVHTALERSRHLQDANPLPSAEVQ